jgi:probable F420-dependent oxidoreductase
VVVPHANVVNFGETVFDPLVTLAVVAGATSRVRLGTTVLIVPYRNAVVTAKMVSSLDALSAGRFVFGIGAGWVAAESAMLGVPFAERGAMTDEYLEAMQELWTKREPTFAGKYTQFSGLTFEPKPVQKPHPPVIVGGESPPALRRAARAGDGWVGLDHTLESIGEPMAKLRQLREAAGRAHEPFEITVGGPVESDDDIRRWEDAGVDRLICSPWRRSPEAIEGLRRFSEIAGAHLDQT